MTDWNKLSEAMKEHEYITKGKIMEPNKKKTNILTSHTSQTVMAGATGGAAIVIWAGDLLGISIPPMVAPVIAGALTTGITRLVAWLRGKLK